MRRSDPWTAFPRYLLDHALCKLVSPGIEPYHHCRFRDRDCGADDGEQSRTLAENLEETEQDQFENVQNAASGQRPDDDRHENGMLVLPVVSRADSHNENDQHRQYGRDTFVQNLADRFEESDEHRTQERAEVGIRCRESEIAHMAVVVRVEVERLTVPDTVGDESIGGAVEMH